MIACMQAFVEHVSSPAVSGEGEGGEGEAGGGGQNRSGGADLGTLEV